MRSFFLSALSAIVVIGAPVISQAAPVTIQDNYVGGTPTIATAIGKDVLGHTDRYDVSHMTVDRSGNNLTVSIFSSYFDNVGSDGTRLGDLFISTNGWNPFGSAPYLNDDYNHGEWMELAAVLDNHGDNIFGYAGANYVGQSGTISLYQVQAQNVELSSGQNTGAYRANQEVRYRPSQGEAVLAFGTWSITDVIGSIYDRLTFSFTVPQNVNLEAVLGFHWGMTCANDTIEGMAGTPVPEPMSLLLLGSGAGGLLLRRRRKIA